MADTLSQARSLRDIPALRQLMLLVGVAAAVAAGISLFMWSHKPAMAPLYGSLSAQDAAQVADALGAAGIVHEVDSASGAVRVPAEQLHAARLQLAGQGLPKGSSMGFEMIQQEQGFGTSQFIESARYQHALEIELARTVSSLQPVKGARVHLALPKASAFARGSGNASASVLVELHAGRSLDDSQTASIVHLVASSVPGLDPAAVTLIDQYGRLMSRSGTDGALAASASRFEQARRLEADYVRRIEQLLTPVTGPGRVSAQVAVDLDFTESEEASETYKPDAAAIRSEQVAEDNGNRAAAVAQGVPGAASNQPPNPAVTTPLNAAVQPAEASGAQSRRSTRNYELDKTLSHTRRPGGSIRRLSVAVLVDHLPRSDGKDGTTMAALSPEELQKVQALVREAVGYSESRGDTLSVQNVPFLVPQMAEPEAMPLWQRADLRDYARQGLGAVLVLVLALSVLRPLVKSALQPLPRPALSAAPLLAADAAPALAQDRVSFGAATSARAALPYDEKLAQARGAVTQDPKRVAQVMKTWIGENG